MSYELNSKAYILLTEIEVGIREFFISLIKEMGVKEWTNGFLGTVQKDTINEVVKRRNEAFKENRIPDIEDIYCIKIEKAVSDIKQSDRKQYTFHPFYYLNWTDMENLLVLKSNTYLIEKKIERTGRELLISNLKVLNNLRNDIAHSRFIDDNELELLSSSHNQIKLLIPDFDTLIKVQSKENNLFIMLNKLSTFIERFERDEVIDLEGLDDFKKCLITCCNSFWLNSIGIELIEKLKKLQTIVDDYKIAREEPGGLLKIIKIKAKSQSLIEETKHIIKNGKI